MIEPHDRYGVPASPKNVRGAWAWFSARELLWITLFVLGSGILLLIPLFVGAQRVPEPVVEVFRALHSAASVLLVVGTLGHAAMRAVRSSMTGRALVSGVLASTIVGLAVVTGSMASAPTWWAETLGTDAKVIENWSSVFHFGYSAAILLALIFWHVRPGRGSLLPSPNRATYAWAGAIMVAALVTVSDRVPATLTVLIAPTFALWAWWTILLPQLLWLSAFRRPRKPTEIGP